MNRPLDPAARLRAAREAKGLSVRQVADITKLAARVIETLEQGKLSALPAGIYRRSIVRAVAEAVGLNPEQLLREFAAARPDDLPAPADVTPERVAPSAGRSLHSIFAFVGTMLPLVAGVAYFSWPAGPAERPAATLPMPPRAADVWRPEIVPAGGFSEAPPAIRRAVVVTLTISARCHLRIVADGRVMLGRTMEQGETVAIELGDEVVLFGDNAAAVQFSINGQAGRQLGRQGDGLSVRIGRDDYEEFLVRY